MSLNERNYIIRTIDGEEFGPVPQQNLISWAKSGRITGCCEVRSTLINKWECAKNISFLKDIIAEMEPEEEEKESRFFSIIHEKANLRTPSRMLRSGGITKLKAAEYESATAVVRTIAGIIDLFICLTIAIGLYAAFIKWGLDQNRFYLWVALSFTLITLYFSLNIAINGQTFGCKQMNLIVICNNNLDLLAGRSYIFALAVLLTWPLMPIAVFIAPTGRYIPDLITGTRVVRQKLLKR